MTKARPILFSAPMVRAILENRKTQTRRIVKPLPSWQVHSVCMPDGAADPWSVWFHFPETDRVGHIRHCPYGKLGDRLWVRETFALEDATEFPETVPSDGRPVKRVKHAEWIDITVPRYRASEDADLMCGHERCEGSPCSHPWKPSIHMPRWASRITLEITDVRVQRLQEISEEDAQAEGASGDWFCESCRERGKSGCYPYTHNFAELWESINGSGSWDVNPFVWAISFRRTENSERAA